VFSNILGFKKVFATLPQGKNIIVDVTLAKIVDHTSILTLNGLVEDYKDNGGTVEVRGFNNHKQLGHAPTSTRILKLS
jgi:MFS superfamily sulfate permease-like transporter